MEHIARIRIRRGIRATVLSMTFMALAGCTSANSAPADSAANAPVGTDGVRSHRAASALNAATVEMTDGLRFAPQTVRIQAGETVTWRNTSELVHTVTADEELASDPSNVRLPAGAEPFDSGDISPGESFSRTFDVPGTYEYFCIPHEMQGMVGTVIVE